MTLENRRQTSGLTLIHSNYFTYDDAGNRAVWQRVESGVDEATYYTCNDADELTHHTLKKKR